MRHEADRIERWLVQEALPFWSGPGVDAQGGFVEQLDRNAAPDVRADRRLRVQARQLYVFSHAQVLGLGRWDDLLHQGFEWLIRHGWDRDQGGFIHRLAWDGPVIDGRRDTYDHAFVLFALAWLYRATGDSGVREWIGRTVEFADNRFRAAGDRGYLEGEPAQAPRRQNPHMHLLEAFLALYDATGDALFLDKARDIIALFHDVFFDAQTGTLVEFFNDDWTRLNGDDGRSVEPGHHFEWVSLLDHYARLDGQNAPAEAARLFDAARTNGLDPDSGLAYDAIWRGGGIRKLTKRCWPQTEALRAFVIMGRKAEPLNREARAWIDRLFRYYLDPAPKGTWLDVMDPENRPVPAPIPASTFYHLFSAFSFVLNEVKPGAEKRC